jgi:phosphate transport system permease protein
VELIAAIPSVVIGFIGLVIVAPWIKNLFNLPTGLTALTGAVMLAWMAMPTIVSIAEDAIRSVPRDYREGSLALGTTHLQTIRHVILPAARSGIVAAVMLGIGRAIGETMTVLMVTGGAAQITGSLLKPVRTMTATIAAEMGETAQGSDHYYALFAVGAVLFLITFAINLIADVALRKEVRG